MIKFGDKWISVDHIVSIAPHINIVSGDVSSQICLVNGYHHSSESTPDEVVELIAACRLARGKRFKESG